jgi:DDE superfamily endonuclease
MVGRKWLRGLLKRHRDLSIRTPEKLSLARIHGFTEDTVFAFYSVLKRVCQEKNIDATRIYNMDESGFGTVVNKAPKVLAEKGSDVSTPSSGERGINTTVVCCVSAAGHWVPPMVIFKGLRIFREYGIGLVAGFYSFFLSRITFLYLTRFLLQGGIIGATESGYINIELFDVWLAHFISNVKPTKEKPVVLVMDGHTSHTKSMLGLELARDHHVTLLQLPAHCTHKMQPLDMGFYGPLGKAYAKGVTAWTQRNKAIKFTTKQFCGIFHFFN